LALVALLVQMVGLVLHLELLFQVVEAVLKLVAIQIRLH
jgi:hypothetical protein